MKRGLSTLLLLVVALALGAYIYFVESKRKPASERTEEKAKVFADLDGSKIAELEVKISGGDATRLKKEADQWTIVAPIASGADGAEVSGITSSLASLEVQRVVEEQASDLAKYGLATPATEVAFKTGGDSSERRLLLGDKTATGGDLYAKLGNEPRVFLVSGFLDTTFKRSTFELRDKAVLKFERDKVTGIEVVSPARTIAFARDGDAWKMTGPAAVRADFGTVEGLVGRIHTGQMKAIVSDAPGALSEYGLDKPTGTVTFVAGSARSVILFGGKTPEGQLYAKDASRPMVFTVDASLADDLNKAPDDFRPKDLYDFRTFTGTSFEVTRGGAATAFEKKKGKDANAPETWAQTRPAKELDSTKIEDFLSKMSNLRAESFVAALPTGATEVARTVAKWSDGTKQEAVAFHRAGADVYAVRGLEPGAAKLTAGDFDEAIKALDSLK